MLSTNDTLLLLDMAGIKKGACDTLCGSFGAGDGNRIWP